MKEPVVDVTAGAAAAFAIFYLLDDSGWFSALVPAILFHESGHWIAVHFFGGSVRSLRLELTGFCMETTSFSARKEEVLCLLAGPAAGLLWAAAAQVTGGEWGQKSARAALWINLFNLLPALPLDGGRILLALTGSRRPVRLLGGLISAGMIGAAIAGRTWELFIPGLFLGKHVLIPEWTEDPPLLFAPAGRSAPGRHS